MLHQNEVLTLMKLLRPYRSNYRKIRLGTSGDGGYVLPDDIGGISAVLSIGVGVDVSFDESFALKGVPIFQYDHTVDGPPVVNEHFHFHKIAWGPADDPNTSTLQTMISRHGLLNNFDSILKFDTEGAEWSAFGDASADQLKHFRIITCELHGLNSLYNPEFLVECRQLMRRLTQNHTVVHLHANNCCGMTLIEGVPVPAVVEVTLLRNDRSSFAVSIDPIPGPLDFPSMADRPDFVLTAFS
jgi:hypothetical protein